MPYSVAGLVEWLGERFREHQQLDSIQYKNNSYKQRERHGRPAISNYSIYKYKLFKLFICLLSTAATPG